MFFYDNFRRNQLRFVRKSKVKCERDFLQFHRCKHAVMHLLNCISHMQSEIEQRHLWFQGKSEKRVLILYRVFRNLSFGNLPGFLWCEAIRFPAFFIFKKGAGFQLQIISRSSLSGKGGFFRFRSKLPASEKRAPENMEVKSEKSNEFQTYENRPGIPWPYRPSRFCRETHL